MKPEPRYQPLPGQFRPLSIRFGTPIEKGYLGDDHLLVVDTSAYQQSIRHVYFEDIQAVALSSHWESKAIGGVAAGGLGACLALMAFYPDEAAVLIGFGSFAALFALLGAVNLWLGPSCRCHMLTPGGWRGLGLWDRWPSARKGLGALLPKVEAAQAALSLAPLPGEASAPAAEAPPGPAPMTADRASTSAKAAPRRADRSALGLAAAAGLYFASACYDGSLFLWRDDWSQELSSLLTYGAWSASIVALVLSLRGGKRALRLALAGLVAVALQYWVGFMQGMVTVMQKAGRKPATVDPRMLLNGPYGTAVYACGIGVGLAAALLLGWGAYSHREGD
jgi:hypothetical protein